MRPDMRSILRSKRILIWIGLAWLGARSRSFMRQGRSPNGVLVPLALAGAATLAAPFVIAFEAAFTTYAVTDRRALIVRQPPARPPLVSVAFADMDRELRSAGDRRRRRPSLFRLRPSDAHARHRLHRQARLPRCRGRA
ncbi:MAG: hypothetical protein M5U33_08005 [Pseudorhodoplanes sp.]|nr:hypothetical protein [Pseudorhodoplanes sp.]